MPPPVTAGPSIRPAATAPVAYRPLARADLRAAAALFATHLLAEDRDAPGAVEGFLARSLLDGPWADAASPSLVAEAPDGRLLGLVGIQMRPGRLGDRAVRLAWPEHLVVDPAARTRAVGVGLLRRVLDGPQDATFADTASPVVAQLWSRLGGSRLELKAVHWVRVYQPFSVAAGVAAPRVRSWARGALVRGAPLLDGAARRPAPPPTPPTSAEPLTPASWVAHRDALLVPGAVHVAYDEASLGWVLAELGRVPRRGRAVAHLVRAADGRALGWYVYLLRPGGRSEALQVAARPRHLGAVLDHLIWHAAVEGSAALRGRLEPGLVGLVAARRCLLWHRGGTLVHTRDRELLAAIGAEGALLTRLEGDWLGDVVG
jgi:hypothetical protein